MSLSPFPLKHMTFYRRRNTAQAGDFTLTNAEGAFESLFQNRAE